MSSWATLNIDEKIEAIREAHAKCSGTARTISDKLFELHGYQVSRNAVIGYYARQAEKLKDRPLCGPRAGENKKPLVREPRTARPKSVATVNAYSQVVEFVPPPVVMPEPRNLTLMELGHRDCRYPVAGEKQHTFFCANSVQEDSPYCAYHHKLCHGNGTRSERSVDLLLAKVA
ncbi:GcrA family cell cycle regulator [Rhizobium leguminosarum]|nr:GcrA family cell cycle regulator [Rhizobium leguminosarum]